MSSQVHPRPAGFVDEINDAASRPSHQEIRRVRSASWCVDCTSLVLRRVAFINAYLDDVRGINDSVDEKLRLSERNGSENCEKIFCHQFHLETMEITL